MDLEAKIKEYLKFPWLIFRLGSNKYSLNSKNITSIVALDSDIAFVPNLPNYIKGIVNLRGEVIPLLDLRALFEMDSIDNEYGILEKMLAEKKQEHISWYNEMKRCIQNKEEFKLATDPHVCNFGKWYYTFSTDNIVIKHNLKKIEEPHQKAHELAAEYNRVLSLNDKEQENYIEDTLAIQLEETVKRLLKIMDKLIESLYNGRKQMVVTVKVGQSHIGVLTDSVETIEVLECMFGQEAQATIYNSKYIVGVGKSTKAEGLILLLNEEALVSSVDEANIDFEGSDNEPKENSDGNNANKATEQEIVSTNIVYTGDTE